MSLSIRRACRATSIILGLVVVLGVGPANAAGPRNSSSPLYYRIGGSESFMRAPNPGMLSLRLGLKNVAALNYSCGRFDARVTIQNLLNSVSQWGNQITNAVQAGVAALPMYVFQRAQPGLYELFQTYLAKAEKEWNIALKSCEEMESEMRRGDDPYEDYIRMAKGEDWNRQASSTQDATQAKTAVETNNGEDGTTWIGGVPAGGSGQPPIEFVHDTVVAGFQLTVNRPVTTPASTPLSGTATAALAKVFPTAADAGDWAAEVLGDGGVSQISKTSAQKSARAAVGLLPKVEAESIAARSQLVTVVTSSGVPSSANMEAASAPSVVVSRELVEALRELPPADQSDIITRLGMEIAQARTIDKALLVRGLLLAGVTGVPELARGPTRALIYGKISDLNRMIDDLRSDINIRREMVSYTAAALVDNFRSRQTQGAGVGASGRPDNHPFVNGRPQ